MKERKSKPNSCLSKISTGKARGWKGHTGEKMGEPQLEVIYGPNAEKTHPFTQETFIGCLMHSHCVFRELSLGENRIARVKTDIFPQNKMETVTSLCSSFKDEGG